MCVRAHARVRVTFGKIAVIRCNQVYWTGQMISMVVIIITSAEKRSLGRGRERIGGIGRCFVCVCVCVCVCARARARACGTPLVHLMPSLAMTNLEAKEKLCMSFTGIFFAPPIFEFFFLFCKKF